MPRLQRPYPAPPNPLSPLTHRLSSHPQPPRHFRLTHALPEQSCPLHPPLLQPRKISPNPPLRTHGFTLSQFCEFVSYLPIKSPKSLTNKDFTGNSFKLKDLGKHKR